MITDNKDKKNETLKNENKKMPAENQSEKFDPQKLKQNQDPNSFGHKQSKEETYEPKKTEMPKGNPVDDQRV